MKKIWVIVALSFALSACTSVLRQPDLTISRVEPINSTIEYNVIAKTVSPSVVQQANKSPFQRFINVSLGRNAPVRRIREADFFVGPELPANIREKYKIGIGDVLTIRESGYPTSNDGIAAVSVLRTDYVVNELGGVFLDNGRRVLVQDLTVAEAEGALSAAILSNKGEVTVPSEYTSFPTEKPSIYRLGAGDVVEVSRLITSSDSSGKLTQSIQKSESVIGPDGVVSILQLGDIELSGLTLPEARNRVIQEAARSATGLEIVIEIKTFSSKSVLITGEFGTHRIILTDRPITYSQLIAELESAPLQDRDFVVVLTRKNVEYRMLLHELLGDSANKDHFVFAGDHLDIQERLPASNVTIDVANANSQSVSYSRVVSGSQVNPNRKSDIIPYGLGGLDLRTLLVSQGVDVDRNQDRVVRIFRNGTEFVHSTQGVLFRNKSKKYWLSNGDQVVVEDIAYVGENALLVGELRAPQQLHVDKYNRTSLSDALFSGRVFEASDADFRQVYVLRGSDLQFDAYHFDFTQVVNLSLAEKFELRPADIVFVRTRPISKFNRALTQVLTAFSGIDTGLTQSRSFGR